ncbi:hypothetical protein ASPZODRAFT_162178 [Penicilliopsis zonata CBS 506.65]|uniref:FAD-binding domain-containing protein n=1 Tax=Penicilliopsis zonata CBS 506.65 TaxID=1073090 RepID=A0A1L9S5Z3_9EURO|nr:hypothetical protein ASPZODRAFT_162178 [Penicilliopsis zonata CBS 506.65]OJJ42589.1 hypothetical protein ASPZODRAFT_162178 [Penicilliopsis zonata CBS 506.65]
MPFKVIIIGGSVTGLTLAHCLDLAGIDYVVLEKHHQVHPQVGASLVIMPNGARVLEQLGVLDHLRTIGQRYELAHFMFPDGFQYCNRAPTVVNQRFQLPLLSVERRQFLEVIYSRLKDKSRVHVEKRVVSIESTQDDVSVKTSDGSIYCGDLVVGADGVNSTVRSEMWRMAAGLVTEEEKAGLYAEYCGLFGISSGTPATKGFQNIFRSNNLYVILVFPGGGGDVYWCVVKKMDRKYTYPDIPRFSSEQKLAMGESLAASPIWEDVRFGDLWTRRRTCSMVALEENLFKTWHHGRIVCIGDSISKMTPNIGQGAQMSIESAAGLTNALRALVNAHEKPATHEITAALDDFQRSLAPRLVRINKFSRQATRLQTMDGLSRRLLARYILPWFSDRMADSICRMAGTGIVLDFVPCTIRDRQPPTTGKSWAAMLVCVLLVACMVRWKLKS